jgi:hypothetical protein
MGRAGGATDEATTGREFVDLYRRAVRERNDVEGDVSQTTSPPFLTVARP